MAKPRRRRRPRKPAGAAPAEPTGGPGEPGGAGGGGGGPIAEKPCRCQGCGMRYWKFEVVDGACRECGGEVACG